MFTEKKYSDAPRNEMEFWDWVRSQYRTGPFINLNNGGVSPHALPVEEAFFNYHRMCNEIPTYTMWRVLEKKREEIRSKLASLANCFPEEIATNRNATESLVTIIMNLPLKKDDEVVLSTFDYPRMMNAWKVREQRDGIKLRWVDPETGNPDKETLKNRFTENFNKKTRVVHLTHMINWTGRMIPVREIIREAKPLGIISVVDAAHSFAHLPFSVSELGCDYLGASLHKWLGAPFGNGLLYINHKNLDKIRPFFPAEPDMNNSIKKFEELGTRNNASEFAISDAVDFHNLIGSERKYERLLYLRNYWVNEVTKHPKIRVITPLQKGESGVIGLVEIEGKPAEEIDTFLHDKFNIHCVAIKHRQVNGVRITPNVYTHESELDKLIEGLLALADS
jgi:selenocysteine lyase/cysteine desulfurase